ncbi:hypothetical protein A6R68_14053 [Neotoma lepida]|uniref:Uncharacterized protein n=1 Tax=Neotoma lepida TaxID=56216 RepID=A0A1A6HBZ1_NEOLE|nr:hypothetical protein A6R68_14053 [Neotoma lepida]
MAVGPRWQESNGLQASAPCCSSLAKATKWWAWVLRTPVSSMSLAKPPTENSMTSSPHHLVRSLRIELLFLDSVWEDEQS